MLNQTVVGYSVAQWTLIGVLLTALFTGLAALMAWLLYRQERLLFGYRRPVRIGRPKRVGVHRFPDEKTWNEYSNFVMRHFRVLTLYIFNRSQVSQSITFDVRKSGVVWPLSCRHLRVQQREVPLPRQRGGNFRILMGSPWPEKVGREGPPDPWGQDWDRRYLVRLSGMTASGHRVWFIGFVRVKTFKEARDPFGHE